MDGCGDNGAGDEQHRKGGSENSNGQEGVQGSHDRHSRVLRGTLYGQNGSRDLRVPACLYLSCGKAERCLNLGLSAAVRANLLLTPQGKRKRADSRSEPTRFPMRPMGGIRSPPTFTRGTWANVCCTQAEACTGTRYCTASWHRMPPVHKDPAMLLLVATAAATAFWAVLVLI